MLSIEQLSTVFVDVADTLAADYDDVAFLHTLAQHAAAVSGADVVSVMLTDQNNELQLITSSNEEGKALELFELRIDEGPRLDCFYGKVAIVNADLTAADDNWPQFAPTAVTIGFRLVHAFPMRRRDQVIGVLSMFSRDDVALPPEEAQVVQALADIATAALMQQRAIARGEALAGQLQGALNSRIIIEQAKGAIAQMEGSTPADAFHLIRSQARSQNRRLVDVAAEVLKQIEQQR